MKNHLYKILLVFSISCFAQNVPVSTQVVIPIEDYEPYLDEHGDIPNGAKLEDINNVRSNYTGTWEGSYDNKELTIVITEGNVSRGFGITDDIMYLRYNLEDSQGATIISTLDLPDSDPLVCKGLYFGRTSLDNLIYILYYQGEEEECNQTGEIYLSEVANANKLQFTVIPTAGWAFGDCSNDKGAHILPTYNNAIQLTKID